MAPLRPRLKALASPDLLGCPLMDLPSLDRLASSFPPLLPTPETGFSHLKVPVCSMDGFCEVFSSGVHRRKVAHTNLNDVSSRSNAVLAIEIKNGARKGKLNLIDLAGNEDNRRTCNEGIRLQESVKINKSLYALSNVIYSLNNNESRVPYRESKLTRIL